MRWPPLAAIGGASANDVLRFVENGLVYRLPWAMESIRVRAVANGDRLGNFSMEDFELGLAVPAVETGTLNRSVSYLVQAGFNSRLAAIKAVVDTGATFSSGEELRAWLRTAVVKEWTATPDWPTAATKPMWLEWVFGFVPTDNRTWEERRFWANVAWSAGAPAPNTPLRAIHLAGEPCLLSAAGERLGTILSPLNPARRGLLRVNAASIAGRIDLSYLGPDDLWSL